MEPIPESLEALTMVSVASGGALVPDLQEVAAKIVDLVPECVGMSVSHFDDDLTFTLMATSERLRLLDAAQYLDGGPCEAAALDGDDVEVEDVLDEDRWQLFALASAAQGVRSSLSLPLRRRSGIIGSVNLYARTHGAFIGREGDVARLFGATMSDAIANADLSMASVGRARAAVKTLEENETILEAVNVLASIEQLSTAEAEDRLYDAANRAGVSAVSLAKLLLQTRR